MATKSLILHVGLPKTGTTSLQRNFSQSRDYLARHGIGYPRDPSAPDDAHHLLIRPLIAGDEVGVSTFAARLGSEHQSSHTILVSSENLPVLPAAKIELLKKCVEAAMPGIELRVVLYLRRWSEYIPSAWQETIKHGNTTAFPVLLNRILLHPDKHPLANFGAILETWSAALGPDAVRAFILEKYKVARQPLVSHFFEHVLGIPAPSTIQDRAHNPSLAPAQTELIRVLNRLSKDRQLKDRNRFSLAAYSLIRKDDPLAFELCTSLEPYAERVAISDEHPPFGEMQRRIAGQYRQVIDGCDGERLFAARKSRAARYISEAYLLQPGMLPRIERLYEAVVARMSDREELSGPRPITTALSRLRRLIGRYA